MNANNTQCYSSTLFENIVASRKKSSPLKTAMKRYCKANNIDFNQLMEFVDSSFNNLERQLSFQEKIYWLVHGMSDFPICALDGCDKKVVKPCSFRGVDYGYSKTCCLSHAMQLALPEIRERNFKKYGVEIPNQFNSLPEFHDKYVQTCIDTYGVDHHCKAPIVKQHVRETNLERYDVEVVNQFNGTEEMMEKYLQTTHEKYGCDHYLQTEEKQEKSKKTCLDNYGVEFFVQSKEFAKLRPKRIEHDGLKFDSKWEVIVYDFCKSLELDIKQADFSIAYEFDGNSYQYYPDFVIGNIIVEVKGPQFFRLDENRQLSMICPYRYDDWTDEYYAWICEKYNAKYKCMLDHSVLIVTDISKENLQNVFGQFKNDRLP